MTKKPLPPKYKSKATQDAVTKLSEQGLSKAAIVRKLLLPPNFFYHHKEPPIWYQNGRDNLSLRVAKDIIKSCETSYLDRKLLSEKLSLFYEPFETKKITSPQGARDILSISLQKFTAGEISELTLNAISKTAMIFIESYNQTILMEDVAELKKLLKAKK